MDNEQLKGIAADNSWRAPVREMARELLAAREKLEPLRQALNTLIGNADEYECEHGSPLSSHCFDECDLNIVRSVLCVKDATVFGSPVHLDPTMPPGIVRMESGASIVQIAEKEDGHG